MNAPDVTSIAPSTGPSSGGTQVSIAGSGLSSATKVLFNDTPALDLPTVTDSLIIAVAPPSIHSRQRRHHGGNTEWKRNLVRSV